LETEYVEDSIKNHTHLAVVRLVLPEDLLLGLRVADLDLSNDECEGFVELCVRLVLELPQIDFVNG